MRRLSLLLCLCLPLTLLAQLRPPSDFLPHQLGETFTPHHLLVDYFQYVAGVSEQVQLIEYGRTNEQRPLLLSFVSTAENLAQLEAIRLNHLRRVGIQDGTPDPALDRAIVWLSFSVHGNEAAGAEASMGVLYDLANTNDPNTQEWLKNTIVILDPCLNPDGYSRYTHWYRSVSNRQLNADPGVREHREPWPGGRVNHYLFDLNRDWAWQTQVESQQRSVQYNQWYPHVHADLHEQGYTSPYYFAPAARPYHQYITAWQADFQQEIGANHAKYFDREGWLYFTKERFDLFYPSYGDTYPTFTGSIGMTYEQGGHSRGGRGIELPTGDTLTLYDRVAHHRTTALSTIEVASQNANRLLENLTTYFTDAQNNPQGNYKSYIVKGTNDPDRLQAFTDILDRNGIQYGLAGSNRSVPAYDYQTGRTSNTSVTTDDIIVSAYQPMSVLTQVLLDPTAELEDSLTYDITAWSLLYAHGLEAYASSTRLEPQTGQLEPSSTISNQITTNTYAYAIPWKATVDAHLLAQLLAAGIQVRTATRTFESGGRQFAPGTLVITRADNRKMVSFTATLERIVNEANQTLYPIQTGLSQSGPDLGSGDLSLLAAPKVAVVSGEAVSPTSFGQVWYFFEQDLEYPLHVLYDEDIPNGLDGYDVLILPDGRYRMSDADRQTLQEWMRKGGKLIAIGSALNALANQSGFGLQRKTSENGTNNDDASQIVPYGGQDKRYVTNSTPGAIFEVTMDTSHPLAYGIGSTYFSLKTTAGSYEYLERGWNVGTVGSSPLISGFVGAQAQERLKESLTFGIEEMGRGSVCYFVDNPLYRGFWEHGKLLFSNALFLVR